jgi:phospholipase/carboxylesterase
MTSIRKTKLGALDTTVVGPERGGQPQLAVVLCHGYGAPGDDLVGLAAELAAPAGLGEHTVFCFPQAPIELAMFGFGARAWWHIDMRRLETAMSSGAEYDLRAELPEGLPQARRQLRGAIELLAQQTGLPLSRIALGGFSQGAMLATDVALHQDEPPAALLAFSGTLLCESVWQPLAAKRQALPSLVTHGRQDPILPFSGAVALRDMLVGAGWSPEFVPFDGPHTIDWKGISAASRILGELLK